jgi:glycosyltransferase involved in cell wall biosynthesis
MRVLFVSCDPLEGAVTRYRCTHLAEALKSAGHTADVATIYDPVIRLEHDIVVLHRICANQEGQALADAVRKSGAALIYGADDLVWEALSPASSLGHPSSLIAPSSREDGLVSLHLAMLRQADGVLVSTNALAEFAREAGAGDVSVVRNVADARQIPLLALPPDLQTKFLNLGGNIRLFYPSGTPTHDADLAVIGETLGSLLETYSELRLVLMGPLTLPEVLKSKLPQIITVPLMDWDNFTSVMRWTNIVLAPLAQTRFNQGKSELKWQEAAIMEEVTVASNWGGFAESVRDGEDGFLATTPDDWTQKLSELIENPELRDTIRCAAFARLQRMRDERNAALIQQFGLWADSGPIHPITFSNPRGFAKGMMKKTLRRLKA